MTVIGLLGKKGSGKDTLASFLIPHGFERRAFADPLKAVLYDMDPAVRNTRVQPLVDAIGWDAAKTYPQVRRMLQRLGVAVREHVSPDAWVDIMRGSIEEGGDYVITDVRFPNEVALVRELGGILVRVDRGGVTHTDSHVSENAWTDVNPDHVVRNNGPLSDLERAAAALSAAYKQ